MKWLFSFLLDENEKRGRGEVDFSRETLRLLSPSHVTFFVEAMFDRIPNKHRAPLILYLSCFSTGFFFNASRHSEGPYGHLVTISSRPSPSPQISHSTHLQAVEQDYYQKLSL